MFITLITVLKIFRIICVIGNAFNGIFRKATLAFFFFCKGVRGWHKPLTMTIIVVMLFGTFAPCPASSRMAETIMNDKIGELTIFDQNYSAIGIPNNVFVSAPILSNMWNNNYTFSFDSDAKAILYHFWTGCNQRLFVTRLYPAVHTTYEITMNLSSSSKCGHIYILIAHTYLLLYRTSGAKKVHFSIFYKNGCGDRVKVPADFKSTGPFTLKISWNGENKTHKIETPGGKYWIPSFDDDINKLQYKALSRPFIEFKPYISTSASVWVDLHLYKIKQMIPRYTITVLPRNDMLAFGFDGPHNYSTIDAGIRYLLNNNYKATLFLDVDYEWKTNTTVKKYYKNLIEIYGWETGIHFTERLDMLNINAVEENMMEEVNIVKAEFEYSPRIWCSLSNTGNVTHANYAYQNFGMLWRGGTNGIMMIGSGYELDDRYWRWWENASKAGWCGLTYTHETDSNQEGKFTITYNRFKEFVENLKTNGIKLVTYGEYFNINYNQVDAYFRNILMGDGYLKFSAYTNGYKAYVDVACIPFANTLVKDLTTGKIVNINLQKDSVQFWVEKGHIYEICNLSTSAINPDINRNNVIINVMIPVAIFVVLLSSFAYILRTIKKINIK